jgi:hypothetical protein
MQNLIFEVGSVDSVLTNKRSVMIVVPFSQYKDDYVELANDFINDKSVIEKLVVNSLIPHDIYTVYICMVNVDVEYSSNSRRAITNEVYSKTNFIINKIAEIIGNAYRSSNFIPIISGKYFLTMKSVSKMVTSNSIFTVPRRKAIRLNKGSSMIDPETLDRCKEYMKSVVCIILSDSNIYENADVKTESVIEKTLIDVAVAAFIPISNTGLLVLK